MVRIRGDIDIKLLIPNVSISNAVMLKKKISDPAGFIPKYSAYTANIYRVYIPVIFFEYKSVYKITGMYVVTSIKMHDVSEVRNACLPLFRLLLIYRAKLVCSSQWINLPRQQLPKISFHFFSTYVKRLRQEVPSDFK